MKIEYVALGMSFACALFFAWKMQKWKLRAYFLEKNLDFVKKNEEKLRETFKALSQDALEKNNQTFLNLAKTSLEKFQETAKGDLEKKQLSIQNLLTPVKESLSKLDLGLLKIEKERKQDQSSLKTHMDFLMEAKKDLAKETANLVKALRTPLTRGRWGEMQLKRVVEMAGMLNHCDFFEQEVGEEAPLRPDLLIKLPGGRQVVVDAKVPLESYLDAVQTENETTREVKLKDYARLIRSHVAALSKKSYYQYFSPTPEFVVLFLPSEMFFSAALQYDPALIEIGADQGVIIATPTTLIALLRAIAYGWKQENLSIHAEKVSQLGHELYKRIVDMVEHFTKMGRSLNSAVEAYNKGIGSLEARVLVSARKFKNLGAASSSLEMDAIDAVEKIPRELEISEDTH